jgi:methionine-R-sulfoxide reductase
MAAAAAAGFAINGVRGSLPQSSSQIMNTSQVDPATGLTFRTTPPEREDRLILTDAEWKKKLTPEQYKILRNHGTEPAFCGVNLESKGEGAYHCVGCDLPLFNATEKFDSGSGWPSYTSPFNKDNLWYRLDMSFGMRRIEVLCARCDGHLGHVFEDGPPPTGLRYCINGTILKFKPKEKATS